MTTDCASQISSRQCKPRSNHNKGEKNTTQRNNTQINRRGEQEEAEKVKEGESVRTIVKISSGERKLTK